jgi:uncharacterized membrane protein
MKDKNTAIWIVALIVVTLIVIIALVSLAFARHDGRMMGEHMYTITGWGLLLMVAMMIIIPIIVIVIAIVVGIGLRSPPTPPPPYFYPSPSPAPGYDESARRRESLEILGQRYARGEITEIEYLRAKDELR